jgi:hypothetical protein
MIGRTMPPRTRILHVSLNARDPATAAQHLAELVGGVAIPFHPVEGAFVCFLGTKEDWNGPLIELYPRTTTLVLQKGKLAFREIAEGINASGAHVNIALDKTREQIEATCDHRGIVHHWRDWQELVEVWLDDGLLIECVPVG